MVFGLLQIVNVTGKTTGFDGGTVWSEIGDHVRGGGEHVTSGPLSVISPWYYVKTYQKTWWFYVEKENGVPVREREARRTF